MSPEEIREHATILILDHARDIERLSIREHLDEEDVEYSNAEVTAIQKLTTKATITVEFPTEEPDRD
jgi:hypothetical protein